MPDVNEAADPPAGQQRPDPDPTVLTTQALFREISQSRELFRVQTDAIIGSVDQSLENSAAARHGIRELLEQRIDATGRLIDLSVAHNKELLQEQNVATTRYATAETAHLREVDDIRFQAAERLASRESQLNALALAAAFAAQKEASAKEAEYTRIASVKSEGSVAQAIDKLGELFATQTRGLGDKVDDLKDRVGRIESLKVGATENRTGMYATIGIISTIFFLVIGILGFLALRAPVPA